MKYIRTKDNRILVADDNSPMAKLTTNKVADTIEELIRVGDLVEISGYITEVAGICDKDSEGHQLIEIATLKDPDNIRIYTYEGIVRKLYIPSSDGYKLVAKMNEEGQLELL